VIVFCWIVLFELASKRIPSFSNPVPFVLIVFCCMLLLLFELDERCIPWLELDPCVVMVFCWMLLLLGLIVRSIPTLPVVPWVSMVLLVMLLLVALVMTLSP